MKQISDPVPAGAAAYVALYPMLSQVANDYGYCLAVHGSLHRDFDIVAIPWVAEAAEPVELIRAIKKATMAVTSHEEVDHLHPDCSPSSKPHGRTAYSLHFTNNGMYGGYLDISFMPLGDVRASALALMKHLRKNVGDTADWPLKISTDDEATGLETARLMTELENILEMHPQKNNP